MTVAGGTPPGEPVSLSLNLPSFPKLHLGTPPVPREIPFRADFRHPEQAEAPSKDL